MSRTFTTEIFPAETNNHNNAWNDFQLEKMIDGTSEIFDTFGNSGVDAEFIEMVHSIDAAERLAEAHQGLDSETVGAIQVKGLGWLFFGWTHV